MRDERIALAQKVAALCQPQTYADAPAHIEVVETHMSFVFLTPSHAFKFKKPVRYAFLDFSTLELRRRYCEEEVRLNERLAPGVYLGVVALGQAPNGRLRIGADDAVVEWLVQMRRLPRERMLDERIRRGALTEHEVTALAARLAHFYQSLASEPVAAADFRANLATELETDRMALAPHAGELGDRQIEDTIGPALAFVARQRALFDLRIAAGRIVEGHGDLRPEHVCLLDEPVVFDSLEFNRRFRIVDPADELAFLALECERLGAAHVGTLLFAGYTGRTGDAPPAQLIDFYKARRASLRARLCILHLQEVDGALAARWVASAARYLALGKRYALGLKALTADLGQ